MFRFITKQHFLVNLLAAIVLVVMVVYAVLWGLGFITRHGQYERVPLVLGKGANEATQILEAKGFSVEIQDSLWMENESPGEVLKQMPAGDDMVKAKRTIYLTINRSQPPLIEMPNLVGLSFRNAELYLKQLGMKLGDTLRKPDIAKDAVLEQLYNGATLRPGTKIFQGSTLTLVLGSGLGLEEMEVPMLVGMTFSQAKSLLSGMGLNPGAIIAEGSVKDTANAFIFQQRPTVWEELPEGAKRKNLIRPGQGVDLWLSVSKPVVEIDTAAAEF